MLVYGQLRVNWRGSGAALAALARQNILAPRCSQRSQWSHIILLALAPSRTVAHSVKILFASYCQWTIEGAAFPAVATE